MKITPITTEDGRHLLQFEAEPGDPMTAQEAAEGCRQRLSEQLGITEMADFTPEVYEAAKRRYFKASRVPSYAKPHPMLKESTTATLRLIREAIQNPGSRSPMEILDHIEYLLDHCDK